MHVGVIGAGTMGRGIAQVAALGGWHVLLADVSEEVATQAVGRVHAALDSLVQKQRLTPDARDAAAARLRSVATPEGLHQCELVIEAVVEDLDTKVGVLAPLAAAATSTILASNTSSLSITRIGRELDRRSTPTGSAATPARSMATGLPASARLVGMHFFNPVPLMPLVEVIAGADSDPAALQLVSDAAAAWGKTTVRAKDTPGFIVNRVARGYYLESLRMLGEGVAGVDEIDDTMKTLGGFRMGPFELMDLIGIDVNYAVTCSVWEQFGRPARLAPHEIQRRLVEAGNLGRKTGRGFYDYGEPAAVPAVQTERRSFAYPQELYEAVRRFTDRAGRGTEAAAGGSRSEQYVFARVLAAVINEAALARDEEVATQRDIDVAMKLGTNWPHGPLEWADRIGPFTVAALLRALNEAADDGRFTSAAALQQ
jgi:3-hydroxybutyryl-CoA dehydrogenase